MKMKHDCGTRKPFVLVSEYPDTGCDVSIYEVKCPACGATGVLSVDLQDNSMSFEETDIQEDA